jgi:hypothetical protein
MEEGNSDNSIAVAHCAPYSPRLALTVRHTRPVLPEILRASQRVVESDNVAPATADLCDGCRDNERHAPDSAENDRSLQANNAALSSTSVANSGVHMLTGACIPAPTACLGLSPVCATASTPASIHDSKLPSGLYKNNGKPTISLSIDRSFFKLMAKSIKANRASKADADVIDEETCTHYTGYYTSNACGGKSRYVNWIDGEATRMRIEVKSNLIRERMTEDRM